MAQAPEAQLDREMLDRIDTVFGAVDYASTYVDTWIDEDVTDKDGKQPIFVWERELIARDVFTSTELLATDLVSMLKDRAGKLIMERWVTLDEENDQGEEELSFAVNMYTGELLQDQPDPNIVSMVEQFKDKFRQIEDYEQA